jgi:DNA-binding CsgD family transcriptional regulator
VAARSRAILCAAGGDLNAAIVAADEALAAHEGAGLPFERGRTLLAVGRIRRRRKEKLLARDALVAARKIFDEMGAELWSGHAAQELQRLGLRRGSPRALTPSEERIAAMVADGLSNREVASALFISPKTVEASLSRVFRKLGIRSRRELRTSGLPG